MPAQAWTVVDRRPRNGLHTEYVLIHPSKYSLQTTDSTQSFQGIRGASSAQFTGQIVFYYLTPMTATNQQSFRRLSNRLYAVRCRLNVTLVLRYRDSSVVFANTMTHVYVQNEDYNSTDQ